MGKHKSSIVWSFFNRTKDPKSTKGVRSKCNLCNYSIAIPDPSKANTSNLTKHLVAKHGEAFKEEKDRREEEKRIQSQNSQRDIKVFELGIGWTNESGISKNNTDPPSLIYV